MAAEVVELEFRGSGTLFEQLERLEGNVAHLGDVHSSVHASIQEDLKESGQSTQKFSKDIAGAGQLVVALAKSSGQGLPALTKNLQAVADLTEQVRGSLSATDKANFTSVNTALREMAKNEGIIVDELDEAKKARIEALVDAKKLTQEEAALLKQVQAVVDTFSRIGKLKSPAPAGGAPPGNEPPSDDLLVKARLLREAFNAASEEAASIGDVFGQDSPAYLKAVENATKLKKELSASVAEGGKLQQRLRATQSDAEKLAKTSGINTAEFRATAQAAADVKTEIGTVVELLSEPPSDRLKTLQQQYRAAYQEAQRLAGTPGPDFDRATAEAARLKEELSDVRARIDALNPDDKIGAFTKLGSAIAGGAQAAGGFFLVFADGNQKLQETIFKFQSFLFALQGAQTFFADIKDAYQNVLAVLGLTTKATVESAAASELDSVAKGEQAVATTATGTASTTAAGGVKAFTAALLTNPIFLFAAGLALVVGAFVALSSGIDETKKSYSELLEIIQKTFNLKGLEAQLINAQKLKEIEEDRLRSMVDLKAGRITQAQFDEADRESRRKAEKNLQDATRQGLIERQKLERDAAVEVQNAYDKLASGAKSSAKEREEALRFLGLDEKATAIEIAKAYDSAYDERVSSAKQASIDIIALDAKAFSEAADRVQQEIEREKAAAELRRSIREELADALASIEKNLADKISSLEIEQADPNKALELRRIAAEKEVNLLERDMRRAVALIELRETTSAEALDRMTAKEREAAADRQIAQGGGKLDTNQLDQIAAFRVLTEQKYLRESIELNQEHARTLLDLEAESAQKRRDELNLDLAARAIELREAGATEAQITADAALKRRALEREIQSDALSLEEQTQLDMIAARVAGSKGNAATERAAQIEVLNVKIEFAEKALQLIDQTGTAEARAQVAAATKVIAELKAELKTVQDQIVPVSIFDLLGLDVSAKDQQVLRDAFSEIGQAVMDIVKSNMEARARDLESQIENTNDIVEDQRRRRGELEAELQKEQDKANLGRANNVLDVKKAIAETQRVEKAALADKKRITQEQQKIARQQVLIDSASQASGLASGVANLIKTWSTLPFGIGLVAAFAQAALIYSFFSGIKNKLASASQPQGLREGTKSVRRSHGEPSGVDTVAAMLSEDEAVVPVKQNRKHRGMVGAIIDDNFSNLSEKDLEPILNQIDLTALLEGTGVVVNEKETREVITLHNVVTERERVQSMSGIETRLDMLNSQVKMLRDGQKEKTVTERMPDGTIVRRGPFGTEILRP